MPDGFVRLRSGEKRPLYGQVTAASGTLTIQGSPAPVCTLYDSAGLTVTGINGVAAAGYDAGALANPRVWYNLDTGSGGPAGALAPGWYTLVFKLTAAGSDSLTRTYEPSLEVQVLDLRA